MNGLGSDASIWVTSRTPERTAQTATAAVAPGIGEIAGGGRRVPRGRPVRHGSTENPEGAS